jgi:hypothetical protein
VPPVLNGLPVSEKTQTHKFNPSRPVRAVVRSKDTLTRTDDVQAVSYERSTMAKVSMEGGSPETGSSRCEATGA